MAKVQFRLRSLIITVVIVALLLAVVIQTVRVQQLQARAEQAAAEAMDARARAELAAQRAQAHRHHSHEGDGRSNRDDPRRSDAVLDPWADWRRVTGNGRRWTRLGVRNLPLHRGCLDLGMAQRVGGGDGPGGKPLPGPRWIHRWHHGGSMRADRLPQTSHRRGSRSLAARRRVGLAHGARGGSRPDRLPDSAGLWAPAPHGRRTRCSGSMAEQASPEGKSEIIE